MPNAGRGAPIIMPKYRVIEAEDFNGNSESSGASVKGNIEEFQWKTKEILEKYRDDLPVIWSVGALHKSIFGGIDYSGIESGKYPIFDTPGLIKRELSRAPIVFLPTKVFGKKKTLIRSPNVVLVQCENLPTIYYEDVYISIANFSDYLEKKNISLFLVRSFQPDRYSNTEGYYQGSLAWGLPSWFYDNVKEPNAIISSGPDYIDVQVLKILPKSFIGGNVLFIYMLDARDYAYSDFISEQNEETGEITYTEYGPIVTPRLEYHKKAWIDAYPNFGNVRKHIYYFRHHGDDLPGTFQFAYERKRQAFADKIMSQASKDLEAFQIFYKYIKNEYTETDISIARNYFVQRDFEDDVRHFFDQIDNAGSPGFSPS